MSFSVHIKLLWCVYVLERSSRRRKRNGHKRVPSVLHIEFSFVFYTQLSFEPLLCCYCVYAGKEECAVLFSSVFSFSFSFSISLWLIDVCQSKLCPSRFFFFYCFHCHFDSWLSCQNATTFLIRH